jgi:hypothetical protein
LKHLWSIVQEPDLEIQTRISETGKDGWMEKKVINTRINNETYLPHGAETWSIK